MGTRAPTCWRPRCRTATGRMRAWRSPQEIQGEGDGSQDLAQGKGFQDGHLGLNSRVCCLFFPSPEPANLFQVRSFLLVFVSILNFAKWCCSRVLSIFSRYIACFKYVHFHTKEIGLMSARFQ